MNVQEVEARMVARISGLEDQESRLQQWLECLRKLDGIAAEWNLELADKPVIETRPVEEEAVSQFESVKQNLEPAHEEEFQSAEDPFDQLRERLVGKSERKSKPVFNSGPLFGANA